MQAETLSVPREEEIVGVPHTSVAVAVPAEGNAAVGLQPKSEDAGHDVNTGAVTSTVHVNV